MTLPPPVMRALTTCACAAALILSACAASVATVTPSSSNSPASGPGSAAGTFSSSSFSTAVPSGWSDETVNPSAVAAVSGSRTVLMLLVAPDGGHIDARTAPQPVPDDQLAQYLQSVGQNGASNLSQAVPVDIGGMSGVVITYTLTSSGVSSRSEDMVVNRGGNTYDIVLNTAQAAFAHDMAALQTVLNGWKWR